MNQTESAMDINVLQDAITSGIIDYKEIVVAIDEMKRKDILEKHPYSIWQNKEGKWLTHLPNKEGKKIVRRRNTRQELEDYLVDFYKQQEDAIYIKDVFEKWIEYKLSFGEIEKQTYDRYQTDYKRYFKASKDICRKKFKNITERDIEYFVKSTIHDLNLTRKAYSGLSVLINGIFKYGKRNGYTNISITQIMGDLDLPKNIFAKKRKRKEKEIFMEDEISLVTSYLRYNADIWNLGLLLQFQTGMRIGEIAALKREDIGKNCIHVRRTECKFRGEDGRWTVKVKDFTKTEAGSRDIILPPTAEWTIRKILELNPRGEYLFMNNGKRIRENTFNKRLSTVCDNLKIPHRSTHKVRKTYGTTLLDNNVDDSFVAEQMGHTDVTTTRKLYYYSNKSLEKKMAQIENAVCF